MKCKLSDIKSSVDIARTQTYLLRKKMTESIVTDSDLHNYKVALFEFLQHKEVSITNLKILLNNSLYDKRRMLIYKNIFDRLHKILQHNYIQNKIRIERKQNERT